MRYLNSNIYRKTSDQNNAENIDTTNQLQETKIKKVEKNQPNILNNVILKQCIDGNNHYIDILKL